MPGVLLGGYCLVYGFFLGFVASRRKARALAYGLHYGLYLLCAALLLGALALLAAGRGREAWETYGMAGAIGLVVALGMGTALKAFYR